MTRDDALLQAHITGGRLRESWTWLALLVEPGPATRPDRPITEAQRRRDAQLARDDHTGRIANAAFGAYALAPEPAPLRLGILDVQTYIHGLVLDAARRVAVATGQRYIAHATGAVDLVDEALAWLLVDQPACFAAGVVVQQLGRPAALVDVRDAALIAGVDKDLDRADRAAREAAGVVDEQRRPLRYPCPACGRRSLYVGGMAEQDARLRYVACNREACRCSGADCGCGQRVRYGPVGGKPGRRHIWPRGEWEGPYGLAVRLGVSPHLLKRTETR